MARLHHHQGAGKNRRVYLPGGEGAGDREKSSECIYPEAEARRDEISSRIIAQGNQRFETILLVMEENNNDTT